MEIKSLFYHLFVEVNLELYNNSLNIEEITNRWVKEEENSNYGASLFFIGTIRDEDDISGLSFDIYKPILKEWFNSWQEISKKRGAKVKMAHSIGDVLISESSYISAVFSPKRRVALELIDEFVEDFKANAPIWKYDLIDKKRVYAKNRSTPMNGAGILKENK